MLARFFASVQEGSRTGRLAVALLVLQLALLLHAAWRVGPTVDEHHYLAAGYAYLEDGDFARNREHPPLIKLLIALPLWLAGDAQFDPHWRDLVDYPVTFFYQVNRALLDRNLFLARLGPCLLTVLGSAGVFLVARRLLGPVGGLAALLAFAFDPNVIAHGSLATLDNGVSVLMFLAVAGSVALLEAPSSKRAVVAGVLFGAANLAKFTALLLVPIGVGLALVAALQRRSLAPLGWTAAAMLAGLGVFAAGYGFEARSLNSAWAEPPYVQVVWAGPGPTPQELAQSARVAGVSEGRAQSIAQADSSLAAVRRLGEGLAQGGAEADAVLAAFEGLHGAPSDLRKLAVASVLEARERLDRARAVALLERLADARQPDLDAWQAWFEAARSESWDRTVFTQPWIERLVRGTFGDEVPVPLFSAWKGLDYQLQHGQRGHGTYYRGRIIEPGEFKHGNPYPLYYLDVLAVKHPLTWLVLVLGGLYGWTRAGRHRTLLRSAAALGVPLVLMAIFMRSHMLMGVRYVLPVLPFLAVLAGALALPWPRAALALAFVTALSGNWIHPHQLMYYGALGGGAERGASVTVLGDDWGQGVRALGEWYQRHRPSIQEAGGLYLESHHASDPATFGLVGTHPIAGRPAGIVAVSKLAFYRERDPADWNARRYAWLEAYEPFATIDRTILIFDTRGGPPGGDPLEAWERAEAAARESQGR